jgi:hypothetical protein
MIAESEAAFGEDFKNRVGFESGGDVDRADAVVSTYGGRVPREPVIGIRLMRRSAVHADG